MDIPVFSVWTKHGRAVICGPAGLLNALRIFGQKDRRVQDRLNGAGAAGIACS